MSTGRYSMRGYASQAWRAAGRALADGGFAPTPVAELTTRLTLIGTSRQRLTIEGTSAERLSARGISLERLSLVGSSK